MTRKSPINCENAPFIGVKGSFRFKREEHLKRGKEIREVFDKGKRFGIQGVKLFVLKNNLPYNRICFTFSRGFGHAVIRNRVRRISREAFRLLKPRLKGGHDLILLALRSISSDKTMQLEELFSKAGLLK